MEIDETTPYGVIKDAIDRGCDIYGPNDLPLSERDHSLFRLALIFAKWLELPDDMPLLPAVSAAWGTPTQLDDRESVAYTKAIAHAAGRGVLVSANSPDN